MKRFYKLVSVHSESGGHGIYLDGKPVKTPSGKMLQTPHQSLAEAMMQEWAAQKDVINPRNMPLTQILNTQIDRVGAERAAITASVLNYLNTDLLCYRAGPVPEGMAEAQGAVRDAWLAWFAGRFGTVLGTTSGLVALQHDPAAHQAVKNYVEALDDAHFTILQIVTALSGSLVLALAVLEKAITPDQVFAAMRAEENFKAKIYNEALHGPDPAQAQKDESALAELKAAAQYLELMTD